MKIKKILALVMAFAMILSLGVTALADAPTAAEATENVHQAQYTGDTTVPTLNIVVTGTNSTLGFNPYKLPVKVDANGVPSSSGTDTADDQLIAKPIVITNLTNAPLKMEAEFTVTVAAGQGETPATLSKSAIAATETAKKIYAYADFYCYDDSDFSKVPDLTKAAASAQRLIAQTAGTGVKHTTANRVTLQGTTGVTGNENYVFIDVNAEATKSPTVAWTADDKITVDLKFTFTTDGNYDKYAVVVKPDSSTDYTVTPVYSKTDGKVNATSTNEDDITEGTTGKFVAGYTCVITPASGKKVTAVKFYDVTGNTLITSTKATATNTKDYTKPWTFTMPASNVVIEATVADVS